MRRLALALIAAFLCLAPSAEAAQTITDDLILQKDDPTLTFFDTAGSGGGTWNLFPTTTKFFFTNNHDTEPAMTMHTNASRTRVGVGTDTPLDELHLLASTNPGIRIEQTGSGGSFQAQEWTLDIMDDESLLLADASSNTEPFRVGADAPDDALRVAGSGNVGLGSADPQAALHIQRGGPALARFTNTAAGGSGWEAGHRRIGLRAAACRRHRRPDRHDGR